MLFNKFEDIAFQDAEKAILEATEPNQGMDFTAHPSRFEAVQQEGRVVNFDGVQVKLEEKAAKDVYARFGKPYFPQEKSKGLDFSLMEAPLFAPHWAAVLNTGASNLPPKTRNLLVRGTKGRDGSTYARAINTELYRPYDGRDVLEYCRSLMDGTGGLPVIKGCKAERDYTSISIYFKDFDDSSLPQELQGFYRVGFRIATGEIGQAATSLRPAVWRTACNNSFVLKGGGVNMKAMYSVNTINQVFSDTLLGTFSFSVQFIETLEEAKKYRIPDLSSVMKGYCIDKGYGKTVYENAINGHEGQLNLFGLINGITHAAKTEDTLLADQIENKVTDILFRARPTASDADVDGEAKMYTWDMTPREPAYVMDQIERWRFLEKDGKLREKSLLDGE